MYSARFTIITIKTMVAAVAVIQCYTYLECRTARVHLDMSGAAKGTPDDPHRPPPRSAGCPTDGRLWPQDPRRPPAAQVKLAHHGGDWKGIEGCGG